MQTAVDACLFEDAVGCALTLSHNPQHPYAYKVENENDPKRNSLNLKLLGIALRQVGKMQIQSHFNAPESASNA